MHLLYNKTKSAIVIGHLVFPFPTLYSKKTLQENQKIHWIFNVMKIRMPFMCMHPVHSLRDGGLLVVVDIFALDSSISLVPSYHISKLIQQFADS